MSLRLEQCRSCRTTFMVEEDPAAPTVPCPKCGAPPLQVTSPDAAHGLAPVDELGATTFVPASSKGRRRRLAWIGLSLLLASLAVAAVVAWSSLRDRGKASFKDPVLAAANDYLQALARGDEEAARKLGTVEIPPAIRSPRDLKRDPASDLQIKGSFAPIAALHARIDASYTYDPAIGRFATNNTLGIAAEVLDNLHEAKDKAERDGLYKKMQSGDPNDLFDAAEALAKPFAALSEGVLSPKKLLPTYDQLIESSKPHLPPREHALAKEVAARRETWDALLKRPFTTLKADGPFLFERAEVTASVVDALGSAGDPPTVLRLSLMRFQLEGINTGWRVTSARRDLPSDTPRPGSPGESRP